MLLVSLSYLLWFSLWKLLKFLLLTKKYLSSCPRHLSRDGTHKEIYFNFDFNRRADQWPP